jgi:hypothetical protein
MMAAALGMIYGTVMKTLGAKAEQRQQQQAVHDKMLLSLYSEHPELASAPEAQKFLKKYDLAEPLQMLAQFKAKAQQQFQNQIGVGGPAPAQGPQAGTAMMPGAQQPPPGMMNQSPNVQAQYAAQQQGAPAQGQGQQQDPNSPQAIQDRISKLEVAALQAASDPSMREYLPVVNGMLSDLRSRRTQFAIDDRQQKYFQHSDEVHANSMAQAERHFQTTQTGTESRFERGAAQKAMEFRQTHPEMEDVLGNIPPGQHSDFVDYMDAHPELMLEPKDAAKAYVKARTDYQKSQTDINASLRMADQVRRFMDQNDMTGDTWASFATGTYRETAQKHGAPLDRKQRKLADLVSQLDAITMQSYVKGTRYGKYYLDKVTTHLPKTGGTYDSIREQLDDLQEFLGTLKTARTPSEFENLLSMAAPEAGPPGVPALPAGFELDK